MLGGGVVVAGVGVGVVAVEHALEEVCVAAVEGGVGLGHEVVAVELVVGTFGAVGVDALGYLAEEGFEVERGWIGGRFGFRLGVGFESLGRRLGWIAKFGDAVFPVIELNVEDTNLADVAAFEAVELGAEVVQVGLAGGESGAKAGELGAAAEEFGVFWFRLAGDRGASGHGTVAMIAGCRGPPHSLPTCYVLATKCSRGRG